MFIRDGPGSATTDKPPRMNDSVLVTNLVIPDILFPHLPEQMFNNARKVSPRSVWNSECRGTRSSMWYKLNLVKFMRSVPRAMRVQGCGERRRAHGVRRGGRRGADIPGAVQR